MLGSPKNRTNNDSIVGADKFQLLSDQVRLFDHIQRDKNLELEHDAAKALAVVAKISLEFIVSKLESKSKQIVMLLEIANLAMTLKPAATIYQVRPAATKIVNNTQLNYVPHAPPKPLLHPAIITAGRYEKGERLTGNIVCIGWVWIESSLRIYVQGGPSPQEPSGNLHIFTWDPNWSGVPLPNAKDIQDDPFLSELEAKGLTACVDALRFLVVFTILLGAEQTPLRVDVEKSKRAESKGGVAPSTWVTRHIYLSEQPTRRDYVSQEETEQALREGLSLEDVDVRGFIRRQRYGPGNSLVKEVYVKGFLSHRWVSPDKKRRIVVH